MNKSSELYGSLAAAKAAGISLRQLYYWVNVLHVVKPQDHPHGLRSFRRFTVADIKQLKAMNDLVVRGFTVRAAVEIIKGNRPAV